MHDKYWPASCPFICSVILWSVICEAFSEVTRENELVPNQLSGLASAVVKSSWAWLFFTFEWIDVGELTEPRTWLKANLFSVKISWFPLRPRKQILCSHMGTEKAVLAFSHGASLAFVGLAFLILADVSWMMCMCFWIKCFCLLLYQVVYSGLEIPGSRSFPFMHTERSNERFGVCLTKVQCTARSGVKLMDRALAAIWFELIILGASKGESDMLCRDSLTPYDPLNVRIRFQVDLMCN